MPTEIVVLIVVLLLLLAVGAFLMAQARKRKQLQSTFGPEYDRTVDARDGRRREAERDLAERAERRRSLDIRPLPVQERQAFGERWRATQEDFVDRPAHAVSQADQLVAQVMERRGYPVGDFEQQARDVSVDHANVVEEYRAAHAISDLNDRQQATTEQLRQAMVHYRALFQDLLADGDASHDRDHGGHSAVSSVRNADGRVDHADHPADHRADDRVDHRADDRVDHRADHRADRHADDDEREVIRVHRERVDEGRSDASLREDAGGRDGRERGGPVRDDQRDGHGLDGRRDGHVLDDRSDGQGPDRDGVQVDRRDGSRTEPGGLDRDRPRG